MNKTEKFIEPKIEVINISKNKDIVQTSEPIPSQIPLFDGGVSAGSGSYKDFYNN